MKQTAGFIEPTQLPETVLETFGARLGAHLDALVPSDFSGFSATVHKTVDGMVAPSARDNYRSASAIFQLLVGEALSIGHKARRYQYLERYKFFSEMPDADMGMAFAEHLWAARSAELYTVLERGESLVRFASVLAGELGAGDPKSATRFAKRFRAQFEYRLRERHRITHAHERPSLTSRLLELREPRSDRERQVLESAIGDLVGTIRRTLKRLATRGNDDDPAPDPLDQAAFQTWYLRRADLEALAMWRIFADAIEASVGIAQPSADVTSSPRGTTDT